MAVCLLDSACLSVCLSVYLSVCLTVRHACGQCYKARRGSIEGHETVQFGVVGLVEKLERLRHAFGLLAIEHRLRATQKVLAVMRAPT